MTQKTKKVTSLTLTFVGASGFAASFLFYEVLRNRSSSMPVPESGQIFPMGKIAHRFFITSSESHQFYALLYGSFAVLILGGFLRQRWSNQTNKVRQEGHESETKSA